MNSITKNLAELGTKIQTGAAEFAEKHELEKKVQPIKQKAEELTAKAGEAIANATKGKEKPTGTAEATGEESADLFTNEPRTAEDSEEPKKRNMRDSITEIASRIKPGFAKIEEGSIGDILLKAKAKVFGADSDEAKAAGASTAIVVGNESYDDVKSDVESIASELEDTGKDVSNKEKVQKLLVPLLAKLKVAQDKFTAMIEARKKKKEEATESAEAGEGTEGATKPKNNLLNSAETAVKKAFENAEKIARDVAKKAGIFDKKEEATSTDAEAPDAEATTTDVEASETKETTETSLETNETVETSPPSTEPETKPAGEDGEK